MLRTYTLHQKAYSAELIADKKGDWVKTKDVIKMLHQLVDDVCISCEDIVSEYLENSSY